MVIADILNKLSIEFMFIIMTDLVKRVTNAGKLFYLSFSFIRAEIFSANVRRTFSSALRNWVLTVFMLILFWGQFSHN
jgi:hypothetical protein